MDREQELLQEVGQERRRRMEVQLREEVKEETLVRVSMPRQMEDEQRVVAASVVSEEEREEEEEEEEVLAVRVALEMTSVFH